ncbi:unnamed protein product [Rangifer tarandus platyrhynchus]
MVPPKRAEPKEVSRRFAAFYPGLGGAEPQPRPPKVHPYWYRPSEDAPNEKRGAAAISLSAASTREWTQLSGRRYPSVFPGLPSFDPRFCGRWAGGRARKKSSDR